MEVIETLATATAATPARKASASRKAPAKRKAPARAKKTVDAVMDSATAEASTDDNKPATTADWFAMLDQALQEPGELSLAIKHLRKYSLSNRWLASMQLRAEGLPVQPVNTFKNWLEMGRCVRKGEKALISLNTPRVIKKKGVDAVTGSEKDEVAFMTFFLQRRWFALSQTDGDEFVAEDTKDWQMASALDFLGIQEIPFEFRDVSDSRQGYAFTKAIAISPLAEHGDFIRLREMARIVLGHTAAERPKAVPFEQELRDVEAEGAAYLCAATLGIPGAEGARANLQAILGVQGREFPIAAAKRAFRAADELINAGFA